MNDIVIKVENLSKLYRLGELHKQTNSFREKVTKAFSRTLGRIAPSAKRKASNSMPSTQNAMPSALSAMPLSSDDAIWALRDVSFEVKRGEIVGIIGHNGAGKTTLLKILSRITKPTEGTALINGRVGSLLEVGTGFHPELSGRENIYLNGAILGMTKAEIRRKFDEIVDFSEIERFIDTPIKRYSSGMYVRLAFSVAAHLEPDILLVDEILAVGDATFQKKCLGKMDDIAKIGRTVFLVSHNLVSIQTLCTESILLNGGRIEYAGDTVKTIEKYLERNHIQYEFQFDYGSINSEFIILSSVKLFGSDLKIRDYLRFGEPFYVKIRGIVKRKIEGLEIAVRIRNKFDILVGAVNTRSRISLANLKNEFNINCKISEINLVPGSYTVDIRFFIPGQFDLIYAERTIKFEVGSISYANNNPFTVDPKSITAPVSEWSIL